MLEDREVIYMYGQKSNPKQRNGVVIACEEAIGVVITDKDDPKLYLFCLHMPGSPSYPHNRSDLTETATLAWNSTVESIKNGVLDMTDEDGTKWLGKQPTAEGCPFR